MKLFKLDFKFCICLRIDVKVTCGEILTKLLTHNNLDEYYLH